MTPRPLLVTEPYCASFVLQAKKSRQSDPENLKKGCLKRLIFRPGLLRSGDCKGSHRGCPVCNPRTASLSARSQTLFMRLPLQRRVPALNRFPLSLRPTLQELLSFKMMAASQRMAVSTVIWSSFRTACSNVRKWPQSLGSAGLTRPKCGRSKLRSRLPEAAVHSGDAIRPRSG